MQRIVEPIGVSVDPIHHITPITRPQRSNSSFINPIERRHCPVNGSDDIPVPATNCYNFSMYMQLFNVRLPPPVSSDAITKLLAKTGAAVKVDGDDGVAPCSVPAV